MLNGISTTMGRTDIYGAQPSGVSGRSDPLGITNPNSNGVAPMTQAASGGGGGAAGGSGPAVAWVGLLVTLVLWRVALHMAREA